MPFHQYFNGNISPVDTPVFHSSDLGLLRGYGVFDYFRTYNGLPFRWDDYWQRFLQSANRLQMEPPISKEEAREVMSQLQQLSGQYDLAFRFLLTGGYSPDSVSLLSPNLLIRAEPLVQNNPALRTNGVKVLPYEYVRDLPEVKSTNYIHMMLMAAEMKKQNASDLLFHKHGEVSELTRSNIFMFKQDSLVTPDQNILSGITRKVVLELAAPHFDIQVRPVRLDELLAADEVFTTSSTKMTLPIVMVGKQPIGDGTPGLKTRFLQKLFEDMITRWQG